jgi:hypothetical protein
VEKPSDVVAVIPHPELLEDEAAYAVTGPHVRGIALSQWPLLDQAHQPLLLLRAELGGTAWREADLEDTLPLAFPRVAPSHHGARMTTHSPRDFVERIAFIQQGQRSSATLRKHRRGSLRPHETPPSGVSFLHYLRRYQ